MSEHSEIFFKSIGDAACKDLPNNWFFPEHAQYEKDRENISEVRKVCRTCRIFEKCYNHALRHEEFGLWAGTSPKQRKVLRRYGAIELKSFTVTAQTWKLNWEQSPKRNRQTSKDTK